MGRSAPPAPRSLRTGTYRSALANRGFTVALVSYALAALSQGMLTVALAVAVYEETGSATWAAVAAGTRLLPYVVLSPFAGVLGDRWGVRRTLEWATIVRIGLVGAVAIAMAVSAPPIVLAVGALLATVAATPVYPAINAFVPLAVAPSDLAAANGLLSTVETVSWILGPAFGGLLLAITSASAAAAAATGVLVAALLVLRVVPLMDRTGDVRRSPSGFRAELAGGIGALRSAGPARAVLVILCAVSLLDGASQVLLVLAATERLGLGDGGYGLLNAAMGGGALTAVLVNRRMAAGTRPLGPLLAAVVVGGAAFASLGIVESAVAAVVLIGLSAAACVVAEVVSVTLLQRVLPLTHLARVFGLLDAIVVAAILLGAALAPVLDAALGLTGAFVVAGLVVPGLLALLAPVVWRVGAAAERRATAIRPLVDLLGALPLLRHAPDPVLQSLALAGLVVAVPAGTTVVREGDAPTDVFAVIYGRFDVHQRGDGDQERLVNQCVAGDCFGEIGPLHGVARTATVRAATAGSVLQIPGPAFVAAVNGNALGSGGSATAGIVTRVATPFEASTTAEPQR